MTSLSQSPTTNGSAALLPPLPATTTEIIIPPLTPTQTSVFLSQIHSAIINHDVQAIIYFIKRGMDPYLPMTHRERDGDRNGDSAGTTAATTPMGFAERLGHADIVRAFRDRMEILGKEAERVRNEEKEREEFLRVARRARELRRR